MTKLTIRKRTGWSGQIRWAVIAIDGTHEPCELRRYPTYWKARRQLKSERLSQRHIRDAEEIWHEEDVSQPEEDSAYIASLSDDPEEYP